MSVKSAFVSFIQEEQHRICSSLEILDGAARFGTDEWQREEGGSGISRVIAHGKVFEKGGVNISTVHGLLPREMANQFGVTESRFSACGISLVLHPVNPLVPTVHANYRYFELYDQQDKVKDQWFGGGSDLTPYYIFPEDGIHFHRALKSACDRFSPDWYSRYKMNCDQYFVNHHRKEEMRGIGGIFYDYLRPDDQFSERLLLEFARTCVQAFLDGYLPIVARRKDLPYGDRQVYWQEIRRGRYVEFNLIHDRGTLFGLKTNGRVESILMSLPPRARWEYGFSPDRGSAEAALLPYLQPRDWIQG
ncbi:MAG TPA: oxygen-dependent coproporphyrinogen oxidase [Chitinophagaceae bacterium]|nr:oxygen-dependent coproporphyrinogen oxidase [Chitinophagaceae bacterium]